MIVHTEPIPERGRNNVAEKVRAVAASSRGDAADDGDEIELPVLAEDEDLIAETTVDGVDIDDPEGENGSSSRRRTRRGSSRRRTRP